MKQTKINYDSTPFQGADIDLTYGKRIQSKINRRV